MPERLRGCERMAHEIKNGKLKIMEVFKQWYRIPEYQRPYVWEDTQVLELLEDS